MMIVASYVAATIFLIFCATYTLSTIKTIRYLRKKRRTIESKEPHDVIVLIPVFKEEEIIRSTVTRFNSVANELNIKIVFISTEREGSKQNNFTYRKVLEHTRKCSNLSIVHCPKKFGAKAAQINYAIDRITKQERPAYFAIFDADSEPDINGIRYAMQCKSSVLQMPSIYRADINSSNLMSKASALFQTRWTFCYEIPKWRKWSQGRPPMPRAMYLVGHGLFINPSIRFSEKTITEDLELGYRLSGSGVDMQIIPYFDRSSVPSTAKESIMQSSRWFYGELTMYKAYWQNIQENTHMFLYTLSFLARYLHIISWMLGIPFIVAMGVYSVASGDVSLGIILVTCTLWYCYVLHGLVNQFLKRNKSGLLAMPIRCSINFLGPMLCLVHVILDLLSIRKLTFKKTVR